MLLQVDVDSTLYDANKLFYELGQEMGIPWPRTYNYWFRATELTRDNGESYTVEEVKNMFRKAHSREYVMVQKPYPHASKVLQGIVNDFPFIEVAFVSDRNSQQTGALRDWLNEHGFLHGEDAHVQATKDKRHWMRERKPEIVIDDRIRTMMMARFELGAYVISLEQPHNVNLTGEVDHIYIAKDWKEIDSVLREIVIPKLQEKSFSKDLELSYAR